MSHTLIYILYNNNSLKYLKHKMPAQRHDIIYWSRMKPICASSSRGCTRRIRYGCGVHEHRLVSILYTQALNTISDKPSTPLTEIYIDISELGENISTVRKIYSIYYSWYIISNKNGKKYSLTCLSTNILSTYLLHLSSTQALNSLWQCLYTRHQQRYI